MQPFFFQVDVFLIIIKYPPPGTLQSFIYELIASNATIAICLAGNKDVFKYLCWPVANWQAFWRGDLASGASKFDLQTNVSPRNADLVSNQWQLQCGMASKCRGHSPAIIWSHLCMQMRTCWSKIVKGRKTSDTPIQWWTLTTLKLTHLHLG